MVSMNSSQEPKRATSHLRRKTRPRALHRLRRAPPTRPLALLKPLLPRHRPLSPTLEARSSLLQTARQPAPALYNQVNQAPLALLLVHRGLVDNKACRDPVTLVLVAPRALGRPLGWGSLWHQVSSSAQVLQYVYSPLLTSLSNADL
jgi:hypothetical protein